MADDTEKSGLLQYFSRADGGILALNFAALTFVAGLQQFPSLAKVVNIAILAGGLCIGLFFAILCVYFTFVGMRTTTVEASRLSFPYAFDTDMPVTIDPVFPLRWLRRFVLYLFVFILPATIVWTAFAVCQRYEIGPTKELSKAADSYSKNDCELHRESLTSPKFASITPSQLKEETAIRSKCNDQWATLESKRATLANDKSVHTVVQNISISLAIITYLLWPLVAWAWVSGRIRPVHFGLYAFPPHQPNAAIFPAMSEAELLSLGERWRELLERIENLQTARMVAAFTSLGAFVLAVGLALINTGVQNVVLGVDKNVAAMVTPNDIRGDEVTVSIDAPFNHSNFAQPIPTPRDPGLPPQSLTPLGYPNTLNLVMYFPPSPNELVGNQSAMTSYQSASSTTNGSGTARSQPPIQKIQIVGLDQLRLPAPQIREVASTPQVIELEGLKGSDGKPGTVKIEKCTFLFFHYKCIAEPEKPADSTNATSESASAQNSR